MTGSGYVKQDAHGIGYFALLADHAPHIFFGNMQSEVDFAAVARLANLHLSWIIHQRAGNKFDQFFQGSLPKMGGISQKVHFPANPTPITELLAGFDADGASSGGSLGFSHQGLEAFAGFQAGEAIHQTYGLEYARD